MALSTFVVLCYHPHRHLQNSASSQTDPRPPLNTHPTPAPSPRCCPYGFDEVPHMNGGVQYLPCMWLLPLSVVFQSSSTSDIHQCLFFSWLCPCGLPTFCLSVTPVDGHSTASPFGCCELGGTSICLSPCFQLFGVCTCEWSCWVSCDPTLSFWRTRSHRQRMGFQFLHLIANTYVLASYLPPLWLYGGVSLWFWFAF